VVERGPWSCAEDAVVRALRYTYSSCCLASFNRCSRCVMNARDRENVSIHVIVARTARVVRLLANVKFLMSTLTSVRRLFRWNYFVLDSFILL